MPSTLSPQPSTPAWYAIHTKPRFESLVQTNLQREGIETFFPKLKTKRAIRRQFKWVTGPLFPCYIFARFEISRSNRLVKYANGVTNIVSFGGKPAAVEEAIILAILAHCEQDVVTIQPPTLRSGDAVEIQEGPFRGLQGIFEHELSGSERVSILLECLGKGARVEVSRGQLEKI